MSDQQFTQILNYLKLLEEKIEDLIIKIDDERTDLNLSLFQVKAELLVETRLIKRRLYRITNTQEEDHLKLPQI